MYPQPQSAPTFSPRAVTPLAAAANNLPHFQDKERDFFCQIKHQAHTLWMEPFQFGVKLTSHWAEYQYFKELEGDMTGSRHSDYKLNYIWLPWQENELVLTAAWSYIIVKLDSVSDLIIPTKTCVRWHRRAACPSTNTWSVLIHAHHTDSFLSEDACVTFDARYACFYLQIGSERQIITVLCSRTSLLCNSLQPEVLVYLTESWGWKPYHDAVCLRRLPVRKHMQAKFVT